MPTEAAGLTQRLVERCMRSRYDALPADVLTVARQCVLDWLGVSLAAVGEAAPHILWEELSGRGGVEEATALGTGRRVPVAAAAEYNGTLSHVLDYDDVHLAITGHATAVVLPALLAQAQQQGQVKGADLLASLVAGCEMACRVGRLIAPSHYDRGFHSTSTAGALGAALACAHLRGLSLRQAAVAVGLAATQASGLKAMFGSMGKPWHAGLAARNGVVAAGLAARGFEGPLDILEHRQGFVAAYSDDCRPDAALEEPPAQWHLRGTLFKYHASCYGTHAAMEALGELAGVQGLRADEVVVVELRVHDSFATVCNIAEPTTGNEARFSLRGCAAMTLAGLDTSVPQTFGAEGLGQSDVRRLMPIVDVQFDARLPQMASEVRVRLADGSERTAFVDAGIAAKDLGAQQEKLERKFRSIVAPTLGPASAERLSAAVRGMDGATVDDFARALERGPG